MTPTRETEELRRLLYWCVSRWSQYDTQGQVEGFPFVEDSPEKLAIEKIVEDYANTNQLRFAWLTWPENKQVGKPPEEQPK